MSLKAERTQKAKRRPAPLSIRLSQSERQTIEQRAGDEPLSTYVKAVLLDDRNMVEHRGAMPPIRTSLAQVLAALGKSQLAPSPQILAQEAANGSLYVDADVTQRLFDAFNQIAAMHFCLLTALGKRPDQPMKLVISLRHQFGQAAGSEAGP